MIEWYVLNNFVLGGLLQQDYKIGKNSNFVCFINLYIPKILIIYVCICVTVTPQKWHILDRLLIEQYTYNAIT